MKLKNIYWIFVLLIVLASCKKGEKTIPSTKTTDQNGAVDIYAAGSNNNYAVYWKNGVATKLVVDTTVHSEADAIAIAGSDVYISGAVFGVATYWKNGVMAQLSTGQQASTGNAIAVNGDDIYVAGAVTTKAGVSV